MYIVIFSDMYVHVNVHVVLHVHVCQCVFRHHLRLAKVYTAAAAEIKRTILRVLENPVSRVLQDPVTGYCCS